MAALPHSPLPAASSAEPGRPVARPMPVALEGAGFALPLAMGAIGLVFARVDVALIAPAVLATLIGMVVLQFVTARSGRPMVYSIRLLEAGTLVGLLDQLVLKIPGWGLPDTPSLRLVLVMAVGAGASALVPLFYALRLQRFAVLIPRPVFAGFNSALAVTLVLSQTQVLWRSRAADGPWFVLVALLGLAAALFAQYRLRRWPPAMSGLVFGSLLALALALGGVHSLRPLMEGGLTLSLPVLHLPWEWLARPGVPVLPILQDVALASATLAALMFLNNVVAEEAASQLDDRRAAGAADWAPRLAAGFCASLLGSLPLGPSWTSTRAALHQGPLDGRAMVLVAVLTCAVGASGALVLVPLASVCGLLLHNAWTSADLPSLRLAVRWLRGRRPGGLEREDLLTVAMVVGAGVLFNMVLAVLVGVIAGLLLYALRNGRHLARAIQDGRQAQSRCARTGTEARILADNAQRIGLVVLEGALFFGAASRLQALLHAQCTAGRFVVVDWSRVVSADSTITFAFARAQADALQSGAAMAVCGLPADSGGNSGGNNGGTNGGHGEDDGEVGAALRAVAGCPVFPDVDRGLEWAEAEVLRSVAPGPGDTPGDTGPSLLAGVSPAGREALLPILQPRSLLPGEQVFAQGDRDDAIMVIMQGSVDIVLPGATGFRLARIRQGATLGEMSFLDGSPRTASAIAAGHLRVSVLTREAFDRYAEQQPEAAHQILVNLALELALRLRQTNRIVAALQQI
ncbi:MAG: cyclic nucleotide-binding domain-containing protein [Pseudomonadota bacterium]